MEDAVGIHAQRREESRGDDVALEIGIGAEERGQDGGEHAQRQHEDADSRARVVEKAPAVVHRTRGSTSVVSTSARRFPVTTRSALTAVAAMTTG